MALNVSLNVTGKKVLIVGGGCVAFRKAQTIYEEGACITVISPQVIRPFFELPCSIIKRNYQNGDEQNYFLVICATNDKSVNQRIFDKCNEQNRLCLSVSNESHMSINTTRKVESLTVSVSTSGENPTFGRWLCERLIRLMDERRLSHYQAHTRLRKKLIQTEKTHKEKKALLEQALELDVRTIEHLIEGVTDEIDGRDSGE